MAKPRSAAKRKAKTKAVTKGPARTLSKAPGRPAAKPANKPAPKPAAKAATKAAKAPEPQAHDALLALIITALDDDKAEDIVTIDLAGRSSLTDALVIASGRSSRHVSAIADHLARRLKEAGYGSRPADGAAQGDWALVDAGDVIVHLFRPEVRQYYDLEGMWRVPEPERAAQ